MPLFPGQTIHNRYRIVKLVGQGGFGAVYRAWDTALEQPVALKENTLDGGNTQRQFEREAKLLAGLRHPNLPRVSDHFIIPGQGQYLVMDFVEGKSLATLLRERGAPFTEADAVKWVRQVSDALTYLHSRTPPVIHRDIKPDNIIIAPDGRAMLVDFGISKIFDESKGTTTGARAVTHGYSPLEQYGRGKTDARSDVYSLGATLYTLLTGLVPPDAPDLVNGTETLLPPHQANPALSETTSAAILAAMAPSISQRLGSAAGFEQLLTIAPPSPARGTVIAPMTIDVSSYTALPNAPADATPSPASSGAGREPPTAQAKRGGPLWGWLVGVLVLVLIGAWAGLSFGGWNGNQGAETPQTILPEAVVDGDPPQSTATATAESSPTGTVRPMPTTTATRPPTPTAEPQADDSRTVMRGEVAVEQVFVPAGSFMMGSEDGYSDERPVHEVTLDAFWIDRTEVTNGQFAACVAAGACLPPSYTSSYSRDQYYGNDEFASYPVIYVSWNHASDFCVWAGGRLPTEAEWEVAARGPEGFTYPWGNHAISCDLANYRGKVGGCIGDTSEVGDYPDGASWVGALDMAGNVWEWVNDWYDSGYYGQSPDGNPSGPASGESRVLRGGAWNNNVELARSAYRYDNLPNARYNFIGFRCAQE